MASRLLVATMLVVVGLAHAARAQTPLTPEFRVNELTTGRQQYPAVAADTRGNFLIVWSNGDFTSASIMGRLYDATGNPNCPEFQLNESGTFLRRNPDAIFDTQGNFVVVWTSFPQDGSGDGIVGRRFGPTGAPLTGEFQVNTYSYGGQRGPRVASGVNGEFVVVWQSVQEKGAGYDVFGQRLDGSGARLGPPFQVNTYTTGGQEFPAIAADAHPRQQRHRAPRHVGVCLRALRHARGILGGRPSRPRRLRLLPLVTSPAALGPVPRQPPGRWLTFPLTAVPGRG